MVLTGSFMKKHPHTTIRWSESNPGTGVFYVVVVQPPDGTQKRWLQYPQHQLESSWFLLRVSLFGFPGNFRKSPCLDFGRNLGSDESHSRRCTSGLFGVTVLFTVCWQRWHCLRFFLGDGCVVPFYTVLIYLFGGWTWRCWLVLFFEMYTYRWSRDSCRWKSLLGFFCFRLTVVIFVDGLSASFSSVFFTYSSLIIVCRCSSKYLARAWSSWLRRRSAWYERYIKLCMN